MPRAALEVADIFASMAQPTGPRSLCRWLSCASCAPLRYAVPRCWVDISKNAATATTPAKPITPAGTATVPSAKPWRAPGGWKAGRRSCCRSNTFTSFSRCRKGSPKSLSITRKWFTASCSAPLLKPSLPLPPIPNIWAPASDSSAFCTPGDRTCSIIRMSTSSSPAAASPSDGTRWNPCRAGFFLPVRVLSRLFRRLFLEQLAKAFQHNQLHFPGAIEPLQAAPAFAACLASQASCEWVVYAKPPFGGPQQVLDYLGRYTHRVAISNQRLLSMEDGNVTFQWKDYRHSHKLNSKRMTLAAGEFIRRFLIHTLPSGFPRIRHFGFLANRHRKQKLKLCRELIRHPILDLLPPIANERQTRIEKVIPPCPHCKIGIMIRIGFLPPYQWPERPPDSS